ncbi:MAG: HAD family hydrolase [Zymomonas sp.]|nr:HAD family hydrolase [Zymomonas sp.]PZP18411.1 MAG: HAD family hydrolase [Sphingomonas hengshuiensis]
MVAPRYKLVIFDFDGTLADSGDWFLSIADDLAERFRFRQVAPDEIEGLRGHTTREVIRYLGIPRWKLPIIARHLHKRLASETHKIALFGGVEAMLATLQSAGVRLALVTSNAEENARAILGPDNMARFEQVECGASLFGKAPRYRRVLKRAGLIAGDILSVGDETRDITAARKVGIDAAAVLWGYARRDALTALDPQLLFDSPDDVIASVLGARG